MQSYKKNIIARAIKARMALEGRTAEDIIAEYINLTQEEKDEILTEIG